jgi:hypothetical protein
MSNITIKEKTSFLPATQSKAFKPIKVPDFIKGIFPYADSERATPSMIKMNKGAALVALGGKGTPQAFITGLMYALSAHAWGQGKAEEMAKALPAYAGEALKHGAAFLPAGKGCDAGMLRSATEEGVFHMLALPAKTRERVVTPTPAIAAPKADNEVGRDYMAQDALLCNPPMDDEQAKRYAGAYLRISQARAEKIKNDPEVYALGTRIAKAHEIAAAAEERAAAAMVDRAIAIAEFIRLAELLAVPLTKAQKAKLAA